MLSRKLLFALATSVLATAGTVGAGLAPAMAQHGGGPGGWHHGSPLLEGVTLTDDQKTKLHALMKSEHGPNSLSAQLRAVHQQIDGAILSNGTVSEASLQPLVQQEVSLMQQVEAQRVSNELAIRNMLTPSQLATASSTHAQMTALHQQEHALMSAGDTAQPQPAD